MKPTSRLLKLIPLLLLAAAAFAQTARPAAAPRLELSRTVRPWEFVSAVGTRAALFGNEAGQLEAWVYPLKVLRNFHLKFHLGAQVLPAESLARTVKVRPESTAILYASDTFQVRETLFVPVQEPGALIEMEIETAEPLEIEVEFVRDFALEWPAAIGGTYMGWDPKLHAFRLGEEQRKYSALVGSPMADEHREEYGSNYSSSQVSSFKLGRLDKGHHTQLITIAASFSGQDDAERIYRHLISDHEGLLQQSADYYREYLDHTVGLTLPDSELQQAYDWARVSMLQGVVTNPVLGTGLIAGYRTAGEGQRPGFAWFFGRDALWTSLALDASGDFTHVRQALEFLSRFQRADGKIPHEISQTASLVPWFTAYPYAYASADATPLFIIAARDYALHSGDLSFINEKWNSIWKAYQFLRSTWDSQGFAQNLGVGHGWVEGGPLRPPEDSSAGERRTSSQVIKSEFYQAGLGVEALRALADLARLTGHSDIRHEMDATVQRQMPLLNQAFWSPDKNLFAFALDRQNRRIDVGSVLTAVPMWFGLADETKAEATIDKLAGEDYATDWGMRIISSRDERYNPGGYHFGSVWPLFTGWAAVGEYRYHRPLAAYANLRGNALLALDGALGHVTEVLSGDYYQPISTSSPHQIWSAAMVVSPLLLGMMGLQTSAADHQVIFAPHIPTAWTSFQISNIKVGDAVLQFSYKRTTADIALEIRNSGRGQCTLEFSPAVSTRARVASVELNARPAPFQLQKTADDQHVQVRFPVFPGTTTVRIRVQGDFGLATDNSLPPLGSTSRNLKFVSQSWNASRDLLVLELAGIAGSEYRIRMWNSTELTSVDGAILARSPDGDSSLNVKFPATAEGGYSHARVVLHFGGALGHSSSH